MKDYNYNIFSTSIPHIRSCSRLIAPAGDVEINLLFADSTVLAHPEVEQNVYDMRRKRPLIANIIIFYAWVH